MSGSGRWLLVAGLAPIVAARPASAEQIQAVEVEVGGRTVHALCTDGTRRVVLLQGESGDAESWRPVLDRLGPGSGACAYDRLWAGAPGEGRGWFELLDELHDVHRALGFRPGYVLVGHSVGGLYARLLAMDRPRDVGGLVLVDPVHEDLPEEARRGMPERAWSAWMARRLQPNADGVREIELARHARRSHLPDIPVTVITAMVRQDGDGFDARFLQEAARRVHASILHGVRQARHVPADGSGHDVPSAAPDLVASEIDRMVRLTTEPRFSIR
jgi:pimeloyl-ACP methyl ester carboxylesterase